MFGTARRLCAVLAAAVLVGVGIPATAQAATPTAGLLWFNAESGQLSEWSLNGTGAVRGPYAWDFNCSTASGCAGRWDMAGVEDFDRDGVQDLLMHRSDTGELLVQLRDRYNQTKALQSLNVRCDTGCLNRWRMVGLGDVDQNGFPDIVWWDSRDGVLGSWLLDGNGYVLALPSLDEQCGWDLDCSDYWRPVDVGDMNGDGRADLVWFNRMSGVVKIWQLGSASHVATTWDLDWRCPPRDNMGRQCSTVWSPEAVGDLNGDGKGDVLWHNPYEGTVKSWLTNGANVVVGDQILWWTCASDCSPDWEIVDLVDTSPPGLPTCPHCPRARTAAEDR